MLYVRPYDEKDKNDFRHICLETASPTSKTEKQKKLLLTLYCDYYTEQEPQNCFALTDENDRAVGYILCSENYERYKDTFNKLYMPKLKKSGLLNFFHGKLDMLSHSMYKKEFPAHLHIDILPEYQRMGGGTALMTALKNHLKEKNIHSLLLAVDAKNIKGVSFYKKYGFSVYKNFIFNYIMTLNF